MFKWMGKKIIRPKGLVALRLKVLVYIEYGTIGEIRICEEVGEDISFSHNCLTNRFSLIYNTK